jgi:hypothetical protein
MPTNNHNDDDSIQEESEINQRRYARLTQTHFTVTHYSPDDIIKGRISQHAMPLPYYQACFMVCLNHG